MTPNIDQILRGGWRLYWLRTLALLIMRERYRRK